MSEKKDTVRPEVKEAYDELKPAIAGEFATKEDVEALKSATADMAQAVQVMKDWREKALEDPKEKPKFNLCKAAIRAFKKSHGLEPKPARDEKEASEFKYIDTVLPVLQQRAFSVGTTTAGGFAIQEEWEDGITETLKEESVVFAMGPTIRETNTDTYNWPAFNAKKTFSWAGENSAPSEGTPTTRNVQFTPFKAIGISAVSSEWMEDATQASANDLMRELSGELAEFLDLAFLEGSGAANTPTGLRNISTSGVNERTSVGALTYNVLNQLDRDMKNDSVRPPFVWIMHPNSSADLKTLVDSNGLPLFVSAPQFGNELAPLGYRVFESAQIAVDQGTSSDETYVLLVKPRDVGIVRRRGITVALSEHAGFTSDQLTIRLTARFDIDMIHPQSLGRLINVTQTLAA